MLRPHLECSAAPRERLMSRESSSNFKYVRACGTGLVGQVQRGSQSFPPDRFDGTPEC